MEHAKIIVELHYPVNLDDYPSDVKTVAAAAQFDIEQYNSECIGVEDLVSMAAASGKVEVRRG